MMRTFNGDQSTASHSHFLEEPIDQAEDFSYDADALALSMMNRSAAPADYSEQGLDNFMKS